MAVERLSRLGLVQLSWKSYCMADNGDDDDDDDVIQQQ